MDIEGAEPDALRGASELLRKHLPVLAVCLYHRSEHLWQIPLYLHQTARNTTCLSGDTRKTAGAGLLCSAETPPGYRAELVHENHQYHYALL